MPDHIIKLKIKYNCTPETNGGWCNGTKIGSRMRCQEVMICSDKSRACNIGFQRGLDELEDMINIEIEETLPDGVPCQHKGCLNHISHPCEGCGRIGGRPVDTRQQLKI